MRPKKLDGFHWREGLISDDIILAEHVRASGAPHRLVIGATIAILPAAGYRDFYLQTHRFIASRAAIRAAGLEAPRIASRGRLRRREVAAAVGRAVCREPLGLPAYVLARTVAAVTQYLDPEHFGDRWTTSRSTKGSTWEAGHSSRATARSSGTSIRFLRPVFVPWAKLAAAIRLTRRCEHGARTAAVIALGRIPGTARFLPRDLVVTARSGPTLRAPRAIESYSPLVEVMGNDCYHFGRLPWERRRDANLRVLDVGAHVGAFAVTLAARYPEAMFTCFEPAPESYSYLEQNAAANGLAARISCHRAAVGTTAGTARLLRSGAASSEATLVPALAPAGAEAIAVPVVDLATAISIGGPPDLVKLDCEGGEYEIVLKSDPCLWESVHCLLLEYHPVPGQSWAELETHLHGLGFRTAWHEPGRFPDLGTAMLQR
jgi:FkbM family methyltransferase